MSILTVVALAIVVAAVSGTVEKATNEATSGKGQATPGKGQATSGQGQATSDQATSGIAASEQATSGQATSGQTASGQTTEGQEAQSEAEPALPKKPYTNLLTFSDNDYKEAFKSLDVDNDDEIKIDDLTSFYYHSDSAFAIRKFMELVDTPKSPGSIDLEEFTKFMKKDQVKRQAHAITLLPTTESRQKYYADEILTYVYLVMDQKAIDTLFDLIESRTDGKLDFNEIQDMQMKLMNGNSQYKLSETETKLVLAELGAGSETVSKQAFREYLLSGDLSFLMRECRKKLTPTGAEYDNVCLMRKLVRFTTSTMTEYMMTLVFDALDAEDKNKKVSVEDIQRIFGCDKENGKRFIRYVNKGKKPEMSYGELRPILGLPAIKTFMEEGCMSGEKSFVEFNGRVFCLTWKLWNLISKKFFPKYTGVPDLDLIFLFEDLDTSGDGTIEQKEDLEKGRGWPTNLARKFMDELGPSDNKEKVNLDDFFRFVYDPYMMCAVAECQIVKDNKAKLKCYNDEMRDMITHVLSGKEVENFFKFYKHNIIYSETLELLKLSEPVIENYLTELGQGDHYVNPVEFKYFVKQQELGHLFSTDQTTIPKKHFAPDKLHEKLLFYLEHFMTEYDTVILFGKLDVNGDYVLDYKDAAKVKEIDTALIGRMALYGNKDYATLQEFWLFLNSKPPGSDDPRKRDLEKGCAQINQEQELNCFKSKLKSLQ